METSPAEKITFTERLALGALSGILAFLTGCFIWFVLLYSLSMLDIDYQPPFIFVAAFGILMFVLGFAARCNLTSNILGAIWRFLYRSLRIWE